MLAGMLLHRELFEQVLAVVFGEAERDTLERQTNGDGSSAENANPFATQFLEDIASLDEWDSLYEVPDMVQGKIKNLFSDEVRVWLGIRPDFSVLRKALFKVAIPPPGTKSLWMAPSSAPESLLEVAFEPFGCSLENADKTVCGRCFPASTFCSPV